MKTKTLTSTAALIAASCLVVTPATAASAANAGSLPAMHEQCDMLVRLRNEPLQLTRALDRCIVERQDHIAGLYACLGGRTGHGFDDQSAGHAAFLFLVLVERPHGDAQPAVFFATGGGDADLAAFELPDRDVYLPGCALACQLE